MAQDTHNPAMLKEEKYFFFASFFPSAPLLVHTRLIAPLPLTSAVVVVVSILCLFLDFLLSMCSLSERHLGRQCTAEATVLCLCACVLHALAAYLDRHRTAYTLAHTGEACASCRCTAKHFHFELLSKANAFSATTVCGSV